MGIALLLLVLILILALNCIKDLSHPSSFSHWFEEPERRAGRIGEQKAADLIRKVLRDNDYLFSNVKISLDDQRTELDNVIVNSHGVFIIEVKNYSGRLEGVEEDYEWTKYHTTEAGNIYSKQVKNPIRQVKRQVYILSQYIKYYSAVKVWIEGYAILLNNESPVASPYILTNLQAIDHAIHTSQRNKLTSKEIEQIIRLLC